MDGRRTVRAVSALGAILAALLLAAAPAAAQEASPPAAPGRAGETSPPPAAPPAPAEDAPPLVAPQMVEVVAAPELDGGAGWFNVDRPLRLADLRGKVVILDFWTYGCINCLHVIPDLQRLLARYAPALAVIGVHSAKFRNEGEADRLRQAIVRYGREHPVVNDRDFRIWRAYGVRAWPTLVVIDADGDVIGGVEGEGHGDDLDRVVAILIADARARGVLDEKPLPALLEKHRVGPSLLAYPGKVLADPAGDRLFVADTNHNRIVITRGDGQVTDVVGGLDSGLRDGGYAEARFDHPQGMALDGTALYVADRENHAIRRVDLASRLVTTVAGTGRPGHSRTARGPGRSIALSSPWDVAVSRGTLYIAMAGPHQLWALDLASGEVRPHAGSGREELQDGPLGQAELAQPSGLATDGTRLYFADSETSAIRTADLDPAGQVRTLVGTGLFDFGDTDGEADAARLQHPLGVAVHAGKVYVADTYNHKVKVVEPGSRKVATLLGDGTPGHADGEKARFFEPGGLSVAGDRLYVADTNNHAIRVADLATGRVSTLALKGLPPPAASGADLADVLPEVPRLTLTAAAVQPGGAGGLLLDIRLPAGYKLAPQAAFVYRVRDVGGAGLIVAPEDRERALTRPALPVRVPFRVAPDEGEGRITVSATFYYCRDDDQGVCLVQAAVFEQPIRIAGGAPGREVTIRYEAPGVPR